MAFSLSASYSNPNNLTNLPRKAIEETVRSEKSSVCSILASISVKSLDVRSILGNDLN